MCKRALTFVTVVALVVGLAAPGMGAEAGEGTNDGEADRVWEVAVVADMNGPYGSKEYNRHVHGAVDWIADELQPDLVVSAGDMVAGQMQGLDYPGMWRAFHEVVTDELAEAGIPLAVTPGNHDASEQPKYWRERIEYARQWNDRRPQLQFVDDRFYPFYYAFELGPALFVSLDGTGVGSLDDAQIEWIDELLDRHGSGGPVVLFSHVPQYPVAEGRVHEVFEDERLAELKETHDVDMMITGHHHAYFPGWRAGTYFLAAHALGSGTRPLVGEDEPRTRNLAVVRFDDDGIRAVEARESPEFDRRVDREGLPEKIGEEDTALWRMDLKDR